MRKFVPPRRRTCVSAVRHPGVIIPLSVFILFTILAASPAARDAASGRAKRISITTAARTTLSAAPLPSPWLNQDVGSVGQTGGACYSAGTFTLAGAGFDIWGAADAFNFSYQSLAGDGEIVARVAGQENTNSWARAGLMIREDLSPGARNAAMLITPFNGTIFQRRTSPGGTTVHTSGSFVRAPYWLKLTRQGANFSGYASSDGANWRLIGTATISLASNVYVGLAVSSHNISKLNTTTFTDVAVAGSASVAPPSTPTAPTPTPTPTPTPAPNLAAPPTKANQFFVSPSGSPSGDGTSASPWDLATALAQPASVTPGATVWLRGGLYLGAFTSRLTGTEAAPITVRNYPGERAVINGAGYDYTRNPLTILGAYAVYWGLEVMNSNPDRTQRRAGAVNVFGHHVKCVNMVVHDAAEGFGIWVSAVDSELYGNLIFNGGWQGASPDRGHGHGIYTQNNTGTKLIRENIIFNQYGFGFHAYTEGSYINGYLLEGNVAFNNGQPVRERSRAANILVGGLKPAERIKLINNYTFHPPATDSVNVQLHYYAPGNRDLTVQGNYFAGGNSTVSVKEWTGARFTDNTLTGRWGLLGLYLPAGLAASTYAWNNNRYFQDGPPTTPFNFAGRYLSLAQWQQATGLDGDSRFTQGTAPLAVFVRPNQYEPGRAHIIVYNAELRTYVDADVSGVLKPGARYEVRNAQDFFAPPVLSGTYDGQPLRLPMYGLGVAQPIGSSGLQPTGPGFNVFVLVPLP
jgi:hypothetical protein